jgi:hypothetical protein
MPRVLRKSQPDPEAIFVAVTSFATQHPDGGYPVQVAEGARLRGDHSAVRACGEFFLPDGASDEELAAARNAIWAAPVE